MKTSCLSDCARESVAILGFGRSGQSVAEYLLSHGFLPTVYTQGAVSAPLAAALVARGVRFCPTFPEKFPEGVLFRSPGIRPDIPPIRRAMAEGAILTGEADLFLEETRATVIGVTGSDGKTTTSNMIAALLAAQGKHVVLGGNNGAPLLSHLDVLGKTDFAVVELSSFQLMTAPSPHIAVITNITPNHLNWHLDLTEYEAAKCRIFNGGASRLVTNAACEKTRAIGARAALPVTWFGEACPSGDCVCIEGASLRIEMQKRRETVSVFDDFLLPGHHNRENFAAAVAALFEHVSTDDILHTARTFCGVRHRLEHVATVGGVTYINSSIDTSPTRTAAALGALACRPIVIAGGRGKGLDLTPLADLLASRACAAILYGDTAQEIARAIRARVRCACFTAFADAFRAAADLAKEGDTVLLSPGCTAFGEFRDFEERGDTFCRLVEELKKKGTENFGAS